MWFGVRSPSLTGARLQGKYEVDPEISKMLPSHFSKRLAYSVKVAWWQNLISH